MEKTIYNQMKFCRGVGKVKSVILLNRAIIPSLALVLDVGYYRPYILVSQKILLFQIAPINDRL